MKSATPTRKQSALEIRDVVLPWLRGHGAFEEVKGAGRMISAKLADFTIVHRTPFSETVSKLEARNYAEAMLLQEHGRPGLPYGLDIWHAGRKVLNIEWDNAERIELAGFRGRSWEAELIARVNEARP